MSKRGLHILTLFLVALMPLVAGASNTRFFQAAQDIPLMSGLVEDTTSTLTYDSPQGRIIESVSVLNGVEEENVRNYYNQTLPAFGWQFSARDEFVRQNEILRMDFVSDDGQKYFWIFIQPR